jgi:pseudolysin
MCLFFISFSLIYLILFIFCSGEGMRLHFFKVMTVGMLLSGVAASAWAAKPVDLHGQGAAVLQSFMSRTGALQPVRSEVDFTGTAHVHFQQTYRGYNVWGADAVMHVPAATAESATKSLQRGVQGLSPATTLNGVIYQQLDLDLNHAPAYVFQAAQADKALSQAVQLHQAAQGSKPLVTTSQSRLIAYVDDEQRARWAFYVTFFDKGRVGLPQKPAYILDAETLTVLKTWNDLKTVDGEAGGGFGGNPKIGKLYFDGLPAHLQAFALQRDAVAKQCFLQNIDVTVRDSRVNKAVMQFPCAEKSREHNNLYWSGNFDAKNGAYSPGNDALYMGKIIKEMYQKWYGIPVLTKNGKPMMLNMIVHEDMENAYWDGSEMAFGDGGADFYPLVSLGVGAHEISHGFTEQHSNLEYYGQSGGLNEAFSDMAAQAAEYYAFGKPSWKIGAELMKQDGQALRYMDEPTKDCSVGAYPGYECSISHLKDYNSGIDVHFSSGIYNKLFYLLSHSPGWDIKKAFDVMVYANTHYWTSTSSFSAATCGVIQATKKYGYPVDPVMKASAAVGITVSSC